MFGKNWLKKRKGISYAIIVALITMAGIALTISFIGWTQGWFSRVMGSHAADMSDTRLFVNQATDEGRAYLTIRNIGASNLLISKLTVLGKKTADVTFTTAGGASVANGFGTTGDVIGSTTDVKVTGGKLSLPTGQKATMRFVKIGTASQYFDAGAKYSVEVYQDGNVDTFSFVVESD